MPKTTIAGNTSDWDVRVGWTPDRDVQVGVEHEAGRALTSVLYGSPAQLRQIATTVVQTVADARPLSTAAELEALGRAILDRVEAVADLDRSYTGVHATLTREGCNALVRAVRRARDSAYGADA